MLRNVRAVDPTNKCHKVLQLLLGKSQSLLYDGFSLGGGEATFEHMCTGGQTCGNTILFAILVQFAIGGQHRES